MVALRRSVCSRLDPFDLIVATQAGQWPLSSIRDLTYLVLAFFDVVSVIGLCVSASFRLVALDEFDLVLGEPELEPPSLPEPSSSLPESPSALLSGTDCLMLFNLSFSVWVGSDVDESSPLESSTRS